MREGGNQEFASPEEALKHFGTKGMKWGVRKERSANLQSLVKGDITRITANGDKLTLSVKPPGKLDKTLAALSQNYTDSYNNGASLTIKDQKGKTVGNATFWNKDKDATYVNWIGVNKSARGNGYATEIMSAVEVHSRAAGKKRMLLEVPGISPDARHIYEKQGFKVIREATAKEAKGDAMWGGLTSMEKKLN